MFNQLVEFEGLPKTLRHGGGGKLNEEELHNKCTRGKNMTGLIVVNWLHEQCSKFV